MARFYSLKNVIGEHQLIALIERFGRNLERLKGLYTDAKEHVVQLEQENDALKISVDEGQKESQELRKKLALLEKNALNSKVSGILVKDNLSGIDTNAELKQQLDEYIRELERCIAHLSSLS